jgi:hypothetical protein
MRTVPIEAPKWVPLTDEIFDSLYDQYRDWLLQRVAAKAPLDITEQDLHSLRFRDRLQQENRIIEVRSIAHKAARQRFGWPEPTTPDEKARVWQDIIVGRIPTFPPPVVAAPDDERETFKPRLGPSLLGRKGRR